MEGKDGNTCGSDQGTSGHLVQSSSGADRGRKGYRQYHKGRDYRGRSNAERGVPKVLTPRSYSSVASPQSEKPSHMQPTESFKNKILPSRPAREIVQIDKSDLDGLRSENEKLRIELEKLKTDKENQHVELNRLYTLRAKVEEDAPLPYELLEQLNQDAGGDVKIYLNLCIEHLSFADLMKKKKKAYMYPNMFIHEARGFLQKKDEILTSDCLYGAYCLSTGLFFKDLKIRIASHKVRSSLVEIAADCHPSMGYTIKLLGDYSSDCHTNWYQGQMDTKTVEKMITRVEDFVKFFDEIDKDVVLNKLKPYLPAKGEKTMTYGKEKVTFRYRKHDRGVFGSAPYSFLYEAFDS